MIPIHLSLSGFLSYRNPVEIDFTAFDLACVAGSNGAGKSSLLDAITWSLFGQARKRDDSVINAQSAAARVALVFSYENNIYRVERIKPRDKTMLLEFNILQQSAVGDSEAANGGDWRTSRAWKPLTERTLRETESRIEQTLRMDYDTFINASFFLQGKADQFTQQRASDRKRILSSILGLEIWEAFKLRAAERRRLVEAEISSVDGRLQEIGAELDEEAARKVRLKELESNLKQLSQVRAQQEAILLNYRQVIAYLAERGRLVEAMARQVDAARSRLLETEARLEGRCLERDSFAELLSRAGQIEGAYADWQAARLELERLEQVAGEFRHQEVRREEPRAEIQAARARLEQELTTLQQQAAAVEAVVAQASELQPQVEALQAQVAAAEARLAQRKSLEEEAQTARQRQAELKTENVRLKADMDELKVRIDRLSQTEGAECPLCGQPLNPQDRQNLIDTLTVQGKQMGDRYRLNQVAVLQADQQVGELDAQIRALSQVEVDLRNYGQEMAGLSSRMELIQGQRLGWEAEGALRLQEVGRLLETESYAPEARLRLVEIDAELKAIGYDAAAHDAVRQAESQGRASEAELRELEKARAALAPLEREIAVLRSDVTTQQAALASQEEEYHGAAAALATEQAQAPDLDAAERELFRLQEDENRLRMEVGAARQKVLILDDLRVRRKSLEAQREEFGLQVGRYKQLERAFGKDGIPALLIEQALPQIENKANEILDRLSGGAMSVRFVTQAAYKDKRREDLRETLDIQISDGAGVRDYEMFSGGEAFRVNFAIRLALSEVLAQRAGARLQTLVIDEGFGSQDAQGRQRLIEAINLVRTDFAKILVITHIDELKDAFPTRIEVEKTELGSVVQVV